MGNSPESPLIFIRVDSRDLYILSIFFPVSKTTSCLGFFFVFRFICFTCMTILPVCTYYTMYLPGVHSDRTGAWISWNLSYRHLGVGARNQIWVQQVLLTAELSPQHH